MHAGATSRCAKLAEVARLFDAGVLRQRPGQLRFVETGCVIVQLALVLAARRLFLEYLRQRRDRAEIITFDRLPTFVDSLQLDGVQLIRLDDTPVLRVKLDIENTPGQRWLIYSAKAEPEPARDWLFDVRMRSKLFRAYTTAIFLEDLGLGGLRPVQTACRRLP